MSFQSKPLRPSPFLQQIRKHPFILFGLPFIGIMIGSSFLLQSFTQTRYDYHATKVQSMSWEEEMGMSKGRKKVDLREEYYKLSNPGLLAPSSLDASLSQPSSDQSLDASQSDSIPSTTSKKKKKKFSMAFIPQDELENVRVPRPEGFPEWGMPVDAGEDAPVKGKRKEDRWV